MKKAVLVPKNKCWNHFKLFENLNPTIKINLEFFGRSDILVKFTFWQLWKVSSYLVLRGASLLGGVVFVILQRVTSSPSLSSLHHYGHPNTIHLMNHHTVLLPIVQACWVCLMVTLMTIVMVLLVMGMMVMGMMLLRYHWNDNQSSLYLICSLYTLYKLM